MAFTRKLLAAATFYKKILHKLSATQRKSAVRHVEMLLFFFVCVVLYKTASSRWRPKDDLSSLPLIVLLL